MELGEIKKIVIRPNDTIVVRTPRILSKEQRDRIAQAFTDAVVLPDGARVIVVDSGMELEVVRQQDYSPNNAAAVADRLINEFFNGVASRDYDAWGREVCTTLARLK